MNKKELASRVVELLRVNDARKPVKIKKHNFTITDEDGNEATFAVKRRDKNVLYTVDDVTNVIDACIATALDSIKRGEEINIRGFGCLGLRYRQARRTKRPDDGEWCEIEAHYIPKFLSGNDLKAAARIYDTNRREAEKYKDEMEVYLNEGSDSFIDPDDDFDEDGDT